MSEWTIIVTPKTYRVIEWHRQFADRVMEEYSLNPDEVTEIRGREGLIEADQLWFVNGKPAIIDNEIVTFTMSIEGFARTTTTQTD